MLCYSNDNHKLCTMLSSHYTNNVIRECTQVTKTTKTLIDLFITSLPEHEVISGVLASSISDHLPIFLLMKIPYSDHTTILKKKFRTPEKKTLQKFCNSLIEIKWDTVYKCNTSNSAYDEFLHLFLESYLKSLPLIMHKKILQSLLALGK